MNAAAVAKLLAPTSLADRTVETILIEDGFDALVIPCVAEERHQAWQICHQLLEHTGRWPVFVADWSERVEDGDFATLYPPNVSEDMGPRRSAILAKAKTLHLGATLDVDSELNTAVSEETMDWILTTLKRDFGAAPTSQQMVEAVGASATERELEQWLVEWRSTHTLKSGCETFRHVMSLDGFSGTGLVLLPTPHSWEAFAFVNVWSGLLAAELIAVARSWQERFGADLVGTDLIITEFRVARPPKTREDAFQLAIEQMYVAPTGFAKPGITASAAALDLLDRDHWVLYESP